MTIIHSSIPQIFIECWMLRERDVSVLRKLTVYPRRWMLLNNPTNQYKFRAVTSALKERYMVV